MPFAMNHDWNLIAQSDRPIREPAGARRGRVPAFGVSDILASFFFSPSRPGLTWGVGPAISLPVDERSEPRHREMECRPHRCCAEADGKNDLRRAVESDLVLFWQYGPRRTSTRCSCNRSSPTRRHGPLTVTLQSETTANWEVDEDRWTVPINVIFAKLSSFGAFPASYQLGFGGFVAHPDIGPSWKIRGAIVILLPHRQ